MSGMSTTFLFESDAEIMAWVKFYDYHEFLVVAERKDLKVDFRAFEVACYTGDDFRTRELFKGHDITEGTVLDHSAAQPYLHGGVKWDGCSNFHIDKQDDCMLHFCSRSQAESIGLLLGAAYGLAKRLMPEYADDLE